MRQLGEQPAATTGGLPSRHPLRPLLLLARERWRRRAAALKKAVSRSFLSPRLFLPLFLPKFALLLRDGRRPGCRWRVSLQCQIWCLPLWIWCPSSSGGYGSLGPAVGYGESGPPSSVPRGRRRAAGLPHLQLVAAVGPQGCCTGGALLCCGRSHHSPHLASNALQVLQIEASRRAIMQCPLSGGGCRCCCSLSRCAYLQKGTSR